MARPCCITRHNDKNEDDESNKTTAKHHKCCTQPLMASTLTNLSLSTPRSFVAAKSDRALPQTVHVGFRGERATRCMRGVARASGPSTPPGISDKMSESIKQAEEACAGDTSTGECAAAWDEVEELSAAASHARDKLKDSDPLENYCKENPESDECRTYDN